jgi:SAM-dependent methyltransferase
MIQFLTRFIPRTVLQTWTHWTVLRVGFIWYGDRFEDPISGKSYRKMLPYGRTAPRPNALAPHSLSLERHRTIWLFLQQNTDFFDSQLRMLHMAPELCYLKRFRKMENLDYVTGDLESPWAEHHFDVHHIPFEEASFDVVMANHLLEHVDRDQDVMKEFYRVLKPGGWGILQVPIDYNNPNTEEDRNVTDPRERERLYWQHDHLRLFGYEDYPARLRAAGFELEIVDVIEQVGEERANRYCLGTERFVYFVRRPL